MKIFRKDIPMPKWLAVLLFPVMAVASAIAAVLYLVIMFLSILVIQTAGAVLCAYSFLKCIPRWCTSAPMDR